MSVYITDVRLPEFPEASQPLPPVTIWKFPFPTQDMVELDVPEGGRTLCVQTQQGTPCLWVLVNPLAPTRKRRLRIFGTGHEIQISQGVYYAYIGTYQLQGGSLVFHVFEVGL